jgi:hypothetical protein
METEARGMIVDAMAKILSPPRTVNSSSAFTAPSAWDVISPPR